jgi:hypothetical protein
MQSPSMTIGHDKKGVDIDDTIRLRIRVNLSQPAYDLLRGKTATQMRALAPQSLNNLSLQHAGSPMQTEGGGLTGKSQRNMEKQELATPVSQLAALPFNRHAQHRP